MKPQTIEFAAEEFQAFALISEEQNDGARLIREREESKAAAILAASLQGTFNLDAPGGAPK